MEPLDADKHCKASLAKYISSKLHPLPGMLLHPDGPEGGTGHRSPLKGLQPFSSFFHHLIFFVQDPASIQ
ncbi:hypothetical protein SLA2020_162400 [Shorea laevis]